LKTAVETYSVQYFKYGIFNGIPSPLKTGAVMQKFLRAIVVLGFGTLVGAGIGVAPLLADSNETAIGSPNAMAQSSLSLGSHHSCALTSAGAVKCWGLNSGGQLGNGTNVNSSAAVDVNGLGTGVIAISAGTFYTCALTSAGAVKCWGANNRGQLGDGTTTAKNVPTDVSGLGSGVVAVSAGGHHSCALTSAGAVKCWGYNNVGQLGDGTTTTRSVPVDVSGLGSGVVAVSAGGTYATGDQYHSCALTSAGAAKCWGFNSSGQVGDGSNTTRSVPVDVSGLGAGVAAVSTGFQHSCALTSAGTAKCWGYNTYGQLGDGTSTGKNVPVDVSGLGSGVIAIHSGGNHTCSLMSTNAVKCWGINTYGQLGVSGITSSNTPVDVGASAPTTTTTTTTNPPSTTVSSSTTVSTNTLVADNSEVDPTTTVVRNLPTTGLVVSEVIVILLGLLLCQFGLLLLLVKHRRRTM